MANDISIRIGIASADFDAGMSALQSKVQSSVSNMNSQFEKLQSSVKSSIGNAMSQIAGLGAVIGSAMSVQHVIEVASTFEQLEIRLNAVMGSAAAGKESFDWIKQFAQNTPYSVQQTTAAFMQLKNFGLDPMDGTLQKVADASAKYGKSADTAERVTLALGQAWARGKLQGQDTLQMIDAGIPVYDLLTKATGKTAAEIQVMSEKGTMGRDVMRQLIDEMGREGAGTAAAKMNSYAGAISNMGDAFENAIDRTRKQGGFQYLTQGIISFTELIPGMVSIASEAFAAIGDVIKVVGQIIMDVMSGIGAAIDSVFGSNSQSMSGMELFHNMLKVIQIAVVSFRIGFQESFEFIKMTLAATGARVIAFAEAANKALKLDFSGAKAAWKEGADGASIVLEEGMKNMSVIAQKGRDDIDRIILGESKIKVSDHNPSPITGGGPATKNKAADAAAKKAAEEALKMSQEALAEQGRVAAQSISIELERIRRQAQLGQISAADEINSQTRLNTELFQIEKKAAEAEAELVKNKPVEYQKAMNKVAEIQRKHDLDMEKQRSSLEIEQKKRTDKLAEEQKKQFDKMFDPISGAFEKSINGIIQGTLTLHKAIRQLAQSIVLEFANMGVKMVVDWVKNEAFRTQASAAGAAARGVIEKTASTESLMTNGMTSIKNILNSAWETLSNVYASISKIPIVGPFLAPVMAAGAFAVVANVAGNIASASGGYDIPAGVNPMTQLHQSEMVLPAHIANPLRDMIASGGSAGGGVTVNISAVDARGVRQLFNDHGGLLVKSLQQQIRNGSRLA
jgi:tape measure domain-containing protein